MGSRVKRLYLRSDIYFPYVLIFPTLTILAALEFFPALHVFSLSLQNYNFLRLYEAGYIGLENFRKIFYEDDLFYHSLWVSFKWVGVQVSLQLVGGLLVALLLNRTFKGRALVRALVFVPWAVSGVLTAILFFLIFNQQIGLLNHVLMDLGLIPNEIAWLVNRKWVFSSVIAADFWRGLPFFAITLLAALQGIPKEIEEACEIDGCGKVRRFFAITLPFLKQTIVFTTLLRAVWEFNSIDLIFNLTGGGPVNMTTTLTIYMMNVSTLSLNYGYGSALAVIGFAILSVFSIVYLALNRFGRGIYE